MAALITESRADDARRRHRPHPPGPAGSSPGSSSPSPSPCCSRTTCPGRSSPPSSPSSRPSGRSPTRKLGALTSVVALTVGLLAVPLSLLGDRWGRVRSIVLMARHLEPGHARLRARGQLRRADALPPVHRRRRGRLRQRRPGRRPRRVPGLPPGLAQRRVHRRRLVRLGASASRSAAPSPSTSAGAGPSPRWPSSAWSWSCCTGC